MSRSRALAKTLIGVVAIGSLLALSACAPEPETTPTPSTSAAPQTPEPEPYAGPLHFTGQELDWFVLAPNEIAAVVPGAVDITEPTASLVQISDGGGAEFLPGGCSVAFLEASLGSVGARTVSWGAGQIDREGRLHVLQYADEAYAEHQMDQYVGLAEQCGEFTYGGNPSTFDSVVLDEGDGVRAVAGSLILDDGGTGHRIYWGWGSVGNVIVEFWQPFTGDSALDANAAAEMLRDRLVIASEQLVDALTAYPPATDGVDPGVADPAAPWNEWSIGCSGVGPIVIGSVIDEAVATVPGASISEPAEGGPRIVTSADGAASIEVRPVEDGDDVAAVTIGDIVLYGEAPVDGTVLPTAEGVAIGDSVEDAITAFPDGTSVRVVSAGMYLYEAATRDGCVLQFHTDRPLDEAGATIIGITAEDATLRRTYGPF